MRCCCGHGDKSGCAHAVLETRERPKTAVALSLPQMMPLSLAQLESFAEHLVSPAWFGHLPSSWGGISPGHHSDTEEQSAKELRGVLQSMPTPNGWILSRCTHIPAISPVQTRDHSLSLCLSSCVELRSRCWG